MTELCKLAIKHKTDKVPFYKHSYTPIYHELLKDKRENFSKVLEIGIGISGFGMSCIPEYIGGASLRMWREYFPNAIILGADIREDTLINEERIKSYQCDQSDSNSLENLALHIGNDFDLIIDDGSHVHVHYMLTAKILLPLLKPDGVYVIEDAHIEDTPDIIRTFEDDYEIKVVRLNKDNNPRDNLVIIQRR